MARGPSRGRTPTAPAPEPTGEQAPREEQRRNGRGEPPPALNIAELERRSREELIDYGIDLQIENAAALPKQELIFRILQDSAERQFTRKRDDLAEWIGARASAGRMVPKGFPKSGRFG